MGEFSVEGLYRGKAGEAKVDVTFALDANGILSVSARDTVTNASAETTIKADRGRLDEDDIRRMIEDIVEQGATMGIPGSGNSRELSGIPGSDFSLPGSENWENRQNPPVIVDAADAFCTMGRIWPSRCPRRTSYGPKVP